MAQSVESQTSAQVMILQFVSSSPSSGSMLTAWSLLTRHDMQSLEKLCADFVRGTKEKNLKIKGQFGYLPRLKITARKTPCGKDSKTWDHFQMTIIEIMRQVIDLHSPSEIVKQITSISIEPGVEVEVTIADA